MFLSVDYQRAVVPLPIPWLHCDEQGLSNTL